MDKNFCVNAGMFLSLAIWSFGKLNIFTVEEGSTIGKVYMH